MGEFLSGLNRKLFQLEVSETDKNREYWVSRPWVGGNSQELRDADILLLPWENFREGHAALFPQGTPEFFRSLQASADLRIAIAIDREKYEEIALHGRASRWPTILVSTVLVPVVVGIITNRLDAIVSSEIGISAGASTDDTIEMELVIEGDSGKCISIKYNGPPGRLIETLVAESLRCLPSSEKDKPKRVDRKKKMAPAKVNKYLKKKKN